MDKISKTVRAIIKLNINNENFVIFIRRRKYNKENLINLYYSFPGGHVEIGETCEQALYREIEEELGIKVEIENEFFHFFNEDLKRDEIFFTCKYISGNIGDAIGEEYNSYNENYGLYDLVFIHEKDINNYNILPKELIKLLNNK